MPSNLSALIHTGKNTSSMRQIARSTLAALGSFLLARFLGLPEAPWAAISALIVAQAPRENLLTVSCQRFAGTVLGAASGAVAGTWFPESVVAYGATLFLLGLLCKLARADGAAFRFAGITLTIVTLLPHAESAAAVAAHRFAEVSLGVAVGLVFSLSWPDRMAE